MYPPFVRNNVPFIPSYTFAISTTRPSRWSPRCIIFSTSIFHPFLDTTSRLGLRATSALLHFSRCWYRWILFSALVIMLEIISCSHLVQLQHCVPTPCRINLRAASIVIRLFHLLHMSHSLLSYCKGFVILPPFIHPARKPTSVPPPPSVLIIINVP